MWSEEYNVLLSQLIDDILDNKFDQHEKEEYLFQRIFNKEIDVKLKLIQAEVEQYK